MNNCPICKSQLQVHEYHCTQCKISFKGNFESTWPAALSEEQLEFVRTFIIVQGNIREMEKALGISYPTVKNRLSEIIGKIADSATMPGDYTDVMYDLEQGFINVEEAIAEIKHRRNK